MIKKIIDWLIWSSKDPAKVSLTVRGALLALVPTVIGIISAACGFGITCLAVDAAGLNQIIEWIAAGVQIILTIVASFWVLWGLARKIYITVKGWFGPPGYTI